MGAKSSAVNTRLVETELISELSVTGEIVFELNGGAPRNNLLDYFYFVDAVGEPVDATAGTVTVAFAPIVPLYQDASDGSFAAATARSSDWAKPNSYGKSVSIRITLTGVTGAPVGFRALVTQSVDTFSAEKTGLTSESISELSDGFTKALQDLTEQNGLVLLELKLLNARFEAMAETYIEESDVEK